MKIYLCGPINACTDEECKDWRNLARVRYGNKKCIDPMKRDYRGIEDSCYRQIVDLDKRDIRMSDVVLVNYSKPSVGTSMEVFYAWTLGIPVVVVAEERTRISPWLRYHSTVIVHGFEDAFDWIDEAL